jgi:hypothetical protein
MVAVGFGGLFGGGGVGVRGGVGLAEPCYLMELMVSKMVLIMM